VGLERLGLAAAVNTWTWRKAGANALRGLRRIAQFGFRWDEPRQHLDVERVRLDYQFVTPRRTNSHSAQLCF
jgi:hypothetical protein